jgi:hypothetical protein
VWALLALASASKSYFIKGIAVIIGGFIGCLPAILFASFCPPKFDVAIAEDWIDYKFLSGEYADEFAKLNQPHVKHGD